MLYLCNDCMYMLDGREAAECRRLPCRICDTLRALIITGIKFSDFSEKHQNR